MPYTHTHTQENTHIGVQEKTVIKIISPSSLRVMGFQATLTLFFILLSHIPTVCMCNTLKFLITKQ